MFALLLLSFENTPKLLCEFRYRALQHHSDILAFHLDFSNHFASVARLLLKRWSHSRHRASVGMGQVLQPPDPSSTCIRPQISQSNDKHC